ncbi:MAG TPA: peroxiredoxin-like family protein, partial [Candidatus Aquilonibacter sp.]|nr:peroxiredoxin-like family protein [Candidatus Aquilonibacter sp.]
MPEPLQSRLDAITAQTRALVQPERLAVTDSAIHDLLTTGIESRVLRPGDAAPAFALPDALTGKLIQSADLLALGPVIVNFFRGRWCPYCVTELEAWQSLYPEVRARGALLIAISPQLLRQNDFTVQQHSLTFPVLTDAGCGVAESFGVAYTVPETHRQHLRSILINIPFIHGDQGDETWRLPLPATFVLKPNANGEAVITFAEAHADHR